MNPAGPFVPYCGAAPDPADVLLRWNLDPPLLIVLALAAAAAALRPEPGRRRALAGVAVLAMVFVSPLCALGSALFSARTLHHLLLLVVAAPLLAAALPGRRLAAATAAQAVALWAWHVPALYSQVLSSDLVYWTLQAALLGSGVWFWGAVRTVRGPGALAALLAAMLSMGLLGALITFAGAPLYAPHLASTQAWGLSPLEDQQVAGLIMWAPAAGAYLAAALLILHRDLAASSASPTART